jgi:hypothetical protein
VAPSGTCASESQRSAPHQAKPPRRSEERPASARKLYDASDRPDSDSLHRRRSRGQSSDSASKSSALQAAESGATPRRLQSLLIRVGGAPNVHVSVITGGSHGPTPAVSEVGGSAPERAGERVAAVEAAYRSGAAPKLAGSKRAALEQGLSGRPAKKLWVRSKM